MNIALVILHADPARGGAERYTLDLAADLAGRGHAVSLLASTFSRVPAGVAQVPLSAPGLTRLGQYNAFLHALDAHLAQTRYDIVHAMLPVHHCDLYHPHAGIAAEALADPNPLNRLNRKRRRFAQIERTLLLAHNGPVVLSLSNYVQRTLLSHYTLPPQRLRILHNGVNLTRFAPPAKPRRIPPSPAPVSALLIAQDFARKGVEPAIRALARVPDDRLHLKVVGKPDPRSYQRLAHSLGVGHRVAFPGPTSDPVAAYAAADFFLLPTRHDPCSLVVLEALGMGLPVITTRQNGASEVMTPSLHGFILDRPDDLDSLASAYRALLDPAIRQRMHQACLELRPSLSQQHHVDRLLAIYSELRH